MYFFRKEHQPLAETYFNYGPDRLTAALLAKHLLSSTTPSEADVTAFLKELGLTVHPITQEVVPVKTAEQQHLPSIADKLYRDAMYFDAASEIYTGYAPKPRPIDSLPARTKLEEYFLTIATRASNHRLYPPNGTLFTTHELWHPESVVQIIPTIPDLRLLQTPFSVEWFFRDQLHEQTIWCKSTDEGIKAMVLPAIFSMEYNAYKLWLYSPDNRPGWITLSPKQAEQLLQRLCDAFRSTIFEEIWGKKPQAAAASTKPTVKTAQQLLISHRTGGKS